MMQSNGDISTVEEVLTGNSNLKSYWDESGAATNRSGWREVRGLYKGFSLSLPLALLVHSESQS